MNDDELRSILHSEADRGEPGEESWSRLESRLHTPRATSAPRAFAFGGVAIAVVVALVAGALWFGRDDHNLASSVSDPLQGSVPKRILAMTKNHRPVVLNARTGKTIVSYESHSYAAGTSIAVAPDGRNFYFVDGEGNKGCGDHSILRFGLRGGRPGAQIADEASEPAISPDGRYLAYYHCLPGDERPDELVLLDLASGVERATKAQATEWFGERLAFDRDSRHVVYESISDDDPKADGVDHLYRLDLVGGEALPGATFGLAPDAWFGVQGSTGRYLGRLSGRADPATGRIGDLVMSIKPTNSELPRVFAMGRVFWFAHAPRQVVSDPTGQHILSVVDHTLYRWSEGDKKPTKIRDGIIAAAWIPDPPRPSRSLPAIVAVPSSPDERVRVLDPRSGKPTRELIRLPDVGYMAATPDGNDVLVGTRTSGECSTPDQPRIERVHVADGSVSTVARGRHPAVSRSGLVAYAIRCDSVTLGFTDMRAGLSSRSNPLGVEGGGSEASPRVLSTVPIGWSPDGKLLLYLLQLRGESSERLAVGRLWPAGRQSSTRVEYLPGGVPRFSGAAFVDDHHVVVGEVVGNQTEFRLWRWDGAWGRRPKGVLFRVRGQVGEMSVDATGNHFLVLSGSGLFRWTRGDATVRKVADDIASAVWLGTG